MGLKNYSLALLTDSFVDEACVKADADRGGYDVRGELPLVKQKAALFRSAAR